LSGPPPENLAFRVTSSDAGSRLDKLVVARASVGRRRAAQLFSMGRVRMDGALVKKSAIARDGALVEVDLSEAAEPSTDLLPELDLRLETAELVVVSKPAGQPSVSLRGGRPNSLAARHLDVWVARRGAR
jgi:23S rRNA-/tRNA-specific pseudouridylate synthase